MSNMRGRRPCEASGKPDSQKNLIVRLALCQRKICGVASDSLRSYAQVNRPAGLLDGADGRREVPRGAEKIVGWHRVLRAGHTGPPEQRAWKGREVEARWIGEARHPGTVHVTDQPQTGTRCGQRRRACPRVSGIVENPRVDWSVLWPHDPALRIVVYAVVDNDDAAQQGSLAIVLQSDPSLEVPA